MGTATRKGGDRLYRRDKVWWCRVRNRAGRIVRKSTRCRDYEAALLVAADFERTAASAGHSAAEETSFESGVNDYLADLVRRGRAAATIDIAQQKTGHMVRLWGKPFPLGRISARVVTEYIDQRLREGASRFTVKKELGHLGQVLRIARYNGRYHLDVEQVIPPYFSGEHRPRKRWLPPPELRALLDELPRQRAAHLAWIVATGARWSESLRAQRSDSDLERGLVRIRGTKTEGADSEVPVTSVNRGLLEEALDDAPGKQHLFWPWASAGRDIKAACARAGIAPCSPNDLRRTFGHWHREAGIPVDLVALMLRHTTDKLAQTTYARLAGEGLRTLVAKQLQSASKSVPGLYQGGALDAPKGPQVPDETPEKQAPPARIGLATFGLGIPSANRRSVGTKLGLSRAQAKGRVPTLYRGVPLTWASGRVFRVTAGIVRRLA